MSQKVINALPASLWNMSAPLRAMLIENSVADAEMNLHKLEHA